MSSAPTKPYALTIAPLIAPMGKMLLMALGVLFVALVLLFAGFILLSGMAIKFWYVPVVMAALMVLVLAAVLLPVVGGFVWVFSKMTRYTLMEVGVTQAAGPATRHIGWLQIRRLECDTLMGVTVVRVIANELDTPITIYHSLLTEPERFWQEWVQRLPHTSIVAEQSKQLAAQLLNQPLGAAAPQSITPMAPQEFRL